MDMDPGEGTSDGRVRRNPGSFAVKIKQEPDIKEESSDELEDCSVTLSNERFEVDAVTATSNIDLVTESEYDFILDFDSDDVKDEVKCEEEKAKKEKYSTNSVPNESKPNAHGGQDDEPMVESNINRERPKSSDNRKKRDGSRKQNKRTIPRNKAAKKRGEHKCHVCGYAAAHNCHFTRHIRIHTGEKPYTCDVCFKCFTHKSHLNEHKKIHSGEKSFECSVCSKSFAQKNTLNAHLRTHPDELPYSCLKCGQRFAREECKETHEKCCKRRRFECYLCEYKCFGKGDQKRHMQAKHTGEKQFQCEICGNKFIQRGDLNQHLATHRNQFSFGCVNCLRGFTKLEDKTAHVKICGRRQYQCYMCEFSSPNTTNFRYHMRVHHTGEKPFHCKWCDKCFIRKDEAESHMKRMHQSKN